jgi:hypothetical protein
MPDQELHLPRPVLPRRSWQAQFHFADVGERGFVIGAGWGRAASRRFDEAMGLVKRAILGFREGVHIGVLIDRTRSATLCGSAAGPNVT